MAENVQRAPLHPLDQFRAFQTLREAASARRRSPPASSSLPACEAAPEAAAVAPALLDAYAETA
ncbi:hypothetical protein [Azospirillum argentinense]|uniref:hypothetical protein n=1 Tax=Azospirillum argentinense TaxID=2970906 RepID=UPI0020001323|nr:hypothetical protein [Azospirillum argentinense]